MYRLKAFGVIAPLIDNTRSVVAPIGELSPIARTYAREKEHYSAAGAPGHSMVVFSSEEDGEVIETDAILASELLLVNRWIFDSASAGQFAPSPESFRTRFLQQYGTRYQLWSIGEMIQADNNVWMPSSIEIREQSDDSQQYRIWYSSAHFEQQFDESEIYVVSPVDNLDVFFESPVAIRNALRNMTQDRLMEKVMEVKEEFPETYLQSDLYEWYDPLNPADHSLRIPVYWTTVIYGIAGRNIDAIKEALREYILANSDHGKEDWEKIFPEIFTSTEYIFIPMWNNYSIPNRELQTGLYSSAIRFKDGVAALKKYVKGENYTHVHIEHYGEILGAPFKAISVPVVGGPNNRDNMYQFTDKYTDYINVDTTSLDFSRMSPETRKFVLEFQALLSTAESMTPDSPLPVRFTRLVREGVLYVSYTLDRFTLIVMSKWSMEDQTIPDPNDPDQFGLGWDTEDNYADNPAGLLITNENQTFTYSE